MRKLNDIQVVLIRHAIRFDNVSSSTLSKQHGVSPSTIRAIGRGERYKDVPEARSIPNFPNYLAYPNGWVWSTTTNKFLSATSKGRNSSKYYQLKNVNNRRSVQVQTLVNEIFS